MRAGSNSAASLKRAYTFIKEAILALRYGPGEPLRTHDLAEQLGLSRTPVREALGRLEQEGLAVRDSGWGYVVRTFTLTEVMDLYRVREALEVEAIAEAVERTDARSLNLLSAILERASTALAAGRLAEFQAICRQFHEVIAEMTANRLLQQMIGTISDQVRIVAALVTQQHRERAPEILEENSSILKAMRAQDPDAAKDAVRNHIRNAVENLLTYYAEAPRTSQKPLSSTAVHRNT
jgi:DNA-binding GntR family transcriptional regulator